jgi:cation diffusion facilitator family transporter
VRATDTTRLTLYAAFAANAVIAVTKFIAAAVTGSSALFSEGLHSIVDTGDGLLILLGLRLSRRPATARHPYGHGVDVYFWTIVVAMSIFGAGGVVSIVEGIRHLARPELPHDPVWSFAVLGVSFVFEGISWLVSVRAFRRIRGKRGTWEAIRRSKDPPTFVVILEDTAALAGIVAAAIGLALAYRFDAPWCDGAASIAIGALLVLVGIVLGRETRSLLLGESAAREVVESIRQIACAQPGVVDVRLPRTMHLGPELVHVDLDVRLDGDQDAIEASRRIEAAVRAKHPEIRRVSLRFPEWA